MSEISQLRDFMARQDIKNDPYWRSILLSDTRNIFPKHELAKIQIAKNNMSKMRLVMEQLSQFLSLQVYAKSMDQVVQSTPEKEIRKQLQELEVDIDNCKNDPPSSDYDFEVLALKQKVEYLCSELAKAKIKPELKESLQKNQKWKGYLQTHAKQISSYPQYLNQKDKVSLARVVNLEIVQDCLTANTAGKIIDQRVKEEVFKFRLKQIFERDDLSIDGDNVKIQNDYWQKQWQQVLSSLKNPIEQQFV